MYVWGLFTISITLISALPLEESSEKFIDLSDEDFTDEDYSDEDYGEEDITSFLKDEFDEAFDSLLERGDYEGASVGVVKNGRLVFAQGYGYKGEREVHAKTLMPISSLSKTLTAVAVLQLAEHGYLSLEDQVFGDDGILYAFKPVKGAPSDPLLERITVDHLLRHAAGWDEAKAPVFDPMMNQLYLARGAEDMIDIAHTMGVDGMLTQYDIIRYMMSTPLDYEPGTRSKYSNFGYTVLGRIIEEVTDMAYEEYIRLNILVPSGMMHTRVGPRGADEFSLQTDDLPQQLNSQYLHAIVPPQLLDSTLGWYSNVYDLTRFTRCLFSRAACQLLRADTVHYMLEKPPLSELIHGSQWKAISLHVTNTGAIWQDSDVHDNDVIFYHQGPPRKQYFSTLKSDFDLPGNNVTIIALTSSNSHRRLKSSIERLVQSVVSWPDNMDDMMLTDLCDSHLHINNTDILVKHRLSEHNFIGYANALKMAGYYPTWMHGYTWDGASSFAIISQKAVKPDDLNFRVGLSGNKKKLSRAIAGVEAEGYHVQQVISYKSFSHDTQPGYAVLMRQQDGVKPAERDWDLDVPLEDYYRDLDVAGKEGLMLLSQSVEKHGHHERVSYVFAKAETGSHGNEMFIAYHDINLERLEYLAKTLADNDYCMSYLDFYRDNRQARFSAVFRRSRYSKWLLQTDMKEEALTEQCEVWQAAGYMPSILVGYELDTHAHRYIGLWVKP